MSPVGGCRSPPGSAAARFVAGAARADQLPLPNLPEIAFAGRSNVGKSLLLNRLVGRRGLARVSKRPGRTQQINFFALGEQLMLVDLPGFGFARVPLAVREQWRQLIEGYLTAQRPLCGVVVIVDIRRGLQAEEAMLLDFLDAHAISRLLVATKIDKLRRSMRPRQLAAFTASRPDLTLVSVSATTGEGITELWGALRAIVRDRRPMSCD